ncbi:MAG TPA: PPOX class F420-dependent oxidoreductase [Pseudonocardiaceae bacterium]|jgi:PPOX class probable F420-dependent enzyme|nr:PPOX class F420-dependent oxidoreductase [Pseudonocardiaceae bacterium]
MYEMTREQWREFALTGTRTGKLAVTRANGAPHVTPVWFVLDSVDDQDFVVFTTEMKSVKAKAFGRDPRFAMLVDDQTPPYSYVFIEGEVTLSEDIDELVKWATKLGSRYMGAERGEEFGKRNGVPGVEYLVRGRITRVTALANISD